MAKAVKPLMIIAAIAVNVIPGIGTVLSAAMITSITTAGIAAAVGMAAGALGLGPKAPKISQSAYDRLQANTDPSAPRKIVFGNTAMAVDIRHQEWGAISGHTQGTLHRVFFHASHKVESIDEIWLDDRLAWNGATQAFYIDSTGSHQATYFTAQTRTEGTAANTIAINGGAKWGSTRRCTGLAYSYMTFRVIGANVKDKPMESPFSSGVPSRMTVRGKGALVYDPRQDSTVGGVGTMRANDQSTWAYTTSGNDIGRNPALQILWYLLGWKINGKLALGRGIPPSRINMASFIAAANACDETVTSTVNGTEPRYRSDGVFSENDDPNMVLDTLKAACNADLRDFGGILSLHIRKNDLAIVSCQLSEDDMVGGFIWKQTPDLDETFNEVRGRFVDPSNLSLYQMRDFPAVRIEPIDSIERAEPFDLPTVQSISQAQRLAKGRLARNLYRGTFAADFNARAWSTGVGKIVELSLEPLGWANKKFRVLEMGVRVDGVVPLLLQEEHADVYLWDNSDVPGVQPFAPTVYDPSLSPERTIIDTISSGATRNVWRGQWADGQLYLVGDLVMVGDVVYETVIEHTSVLGVPPPNANFVLWFSTGASGIDGLSAVLTKPTAQLPSSFDGIIQPADYATATGSWQIMAGNSNVTAAFRPITTVSNPVTLDVTYVNDTYSVTGGFDQNLDSAELTMQMLGTGSYAGITFQRVFTLTKAKAPFPVDTDSTPPATPTGLALSSTLTLQPDGSHSAMLTASWTANGEADLGYYVLSVRQSAGNYVDFIVGRNNPRWTGPGVAGVTYEAILRAVDNNGNQSTATAMASHTITGDTTAPGVATGAAAVAAFQTIFLTWTNPTVGDLAQVQVWEHTANTSGSATLIATVNAQSGQKGAFTRSGLATGVTRYYWLKTVDNSGNASGFSAVASATTGNVPAVDISGTLTNAQIDSIAATKVTGQIVATQITDGAVSAPKIAANAVVAGKIAAGTIVAADIAAGTITGDKIAANTITATQIAASTITSTQIAAGTIVADDIAGGTITGDKISTSTSLPGSITVGVTGVTIETVRVDATGGRGGNLLPNADLSQNTEGWVFTGNTSGRDHAGDSWRPIPEHTAGTSTLLPAAGGSYAMSPVVKVNPGEWIEGQGLIAAHRASAGLNLKFYNEALTVETGAIFSGWSVPGTGGQQLSGYTHKWAKMQVPAGSSYARIVLEKAATDAGQTDSHAWIVRPYIGVASANQSTASPFAYAAPPTVPDPIALANSKSTQILPGLVNISGGTTLASWRNGSDTTKIEGGSIAANTILANKLTVGSRNIKVLGVEFQVNAALTSLSWGDGYIFYVDNNGGEQAVAITAGSVAWGGSALYIYWTQGATTLGATTTWSNVLADENVQLLCTWWGNARFVANNGGTIVHGSNITAGTVTANKLVVGYVSAGWADIGVLRTATSGARLEIDTTQVRVYDANRLRVRMGIW